MMDARKMSALRNAPRRVIAEADRERVIQEFTHVVKAMAHRLAFRLPAYMDAEDLMSVGIMGLMDAMDKYDPTREAKFKTYAEFRIRGAMLDEIRSMDWIPRSVHERLRSFKRPIPSCCTDSDARRQTRKSAKS
jgi:RNA polymerase sigma factor for flagellar operon FliA